MVAVNCITVLGGLFRVKCDSRQSKIDPIECRSGKDEYFRDLVVVNKYYLNKLLAITALTAVVTMVAPVSVFADNDSLSRWRDDPLQLSVKFERQSAIFDTFGQNTSWSNEFDDLALSPQGTKYSLDSRRISQFDAAFFYPFQRGKFNFDLGINLKFINGVTEHTDASGVVTSQAFNTTLPMMYATALYELPWKGLSAGIEGKHMVFDSSTAYDYKAVLTYQSRSGFGLNGGWQYQQLHLNAFQNITASRETAGPFVDFYFKF